MPAIGRLGLSAISLIVANAAVLYLYLHYDLSLIQVVLIYWCECVWIGFFSAAKLILASIIGDPYENRWAEFSKGGALFASIVVIFFSSSAFFTVLGAVLMIVLFVQHSFDAGSSGIELLGHVSVVIGTSMVLLVSHGISFVTNFLILGEFRRARFGDLVAMPFKRSLALLLAIVVSLIFVILLPWLASTTLFAAIVVALKLALDLRLHRRERLTFAAADHGSASS